MKSLMLLYGGFFSGGGGGAVSQKREAHEFKIRTSGKIEQCPRLGVDIYHDKRRGFLKVRVRRSIRDKYYITLNPP